VIWDETACQRSHGGSLVVTVDRLVPVPPDGRVALDLVVYLVLALALGAVRWREIYDFVCAARYRTASLPA